MWAIQLVKRENVGTQNALTKTNLQIQYTLQYQPYASDQYNKVSIL